MIPRWDVNTTTELVAGFAAEVNDTTPLLSSAIDRRLYDRGRSKCLVIFRAAASPSGAVSNGVTFTVTESATSGGVYTKATTDGSLTIVSAAGGRTCGVLYNNAMPFMKIVATGDNANTLYFVTGLVVFIGPSV